MSLSSSFKIVAGLLVSTAVLPAAATLTSLSVTESYPPCAPFDITITGSGFDNSAEASLGGSFLATTFVSGTEVIATVTSADLASPGATSVVVSLAEQADSNALPFTINPTPFNSMSPDTADAGSGDTLLTVTGSCYEPGAEILWDGSPLTTTFVSSTTLTATIPAADLASSGSAAVSVSNANGNTSTTQFFAIEDPDPVVSSVLPTASYPPCAPFEITVTGQHFVGGDEVVMGSNLPTTFVNSTTLTGTVTSADLASPGAVSVFVERPEDSTSNSVSFTISATPLDSISPSSAMAGDGATLLTVTGSCYESGAEILWEGSPLTTTFVNSNTLTATIPAANLASAGSAAVSVRNANGNTSGPLPFTIGDPAPVLSSLTPTASYPPCAPFDITISGQHFTAAAEAFLGGVPLVTSFLSSTEVTATVTSARLATAGSAPVVVRIPAQPDSNSLPFLIRATPVDGLLPASAPAGSGDTLLTITGSCYEPGAEILWDGSPLPTTFVNSATLTATIPAANLASSGSAAVSVRNENGNTSATLPFTIGQPPAVITSLSPTQVTVGSGPVLVEVSGSGFQSGAEVLLDGAPLPASAVSWLNAGLIRMTVPASALSTAGVMLVEVQNPNGPLSNATSLTVAPASNPVVIERVAPPTGQPPCAPFEITVAGRNLPSDGQVVMGGVPLATNPGAGSTLVATVTSTAMAQSGAVDVIVRNSNGDNSAPFPFLVNPTPVSSVLPGSSPVGGPALPIEVKGSCFEPGATILWDGTPLATTFTSSSTLDAIVPAENFDSPGVAQVTVLNPNGNESVAFPFRIGPPPGGSLTPVITSLAPSETTAGTQPLTLNINGRDFDAAARVLLNGMAAPKGDIQWLDSTRILLTLRATTLAEAAVIPIVVENTGGGRSSPALFRVLPLITGLNPRMWTVGQPCELIAFGRGFTAASFVLFEGAAGVSRLTPTAPPTVTQIRVCVPPEQVDSTGPTRVRVCTTIDDEDICSSAVTLDVTPGIRITGIRPMSAVAGSGSLCLAVDVVTATAPGALTARWDDVDLPPGMTACPPPVAGLGAEAPEGVTGVFAATVFARVGAPLLARKRPRDPAVACPGDPLAPKITAFAAGLQAVSAPACFDITALTPIFNPPTTSLRDDGCVSVMLTGENIHSAVAVAVEGFDGQFCSGGTPTASGCGIDAADSSICTKVGFAVPAGSGVLTVTVRNPPNVCSSCSGQTFSVSLDDLEMDLPPDALSVSCPAEGSSFARTPVGSQSRLSCQITNSSDQIGRAGALSLAAPFAVESSDCGDVILNPGEGCGAELTFAPARPGLFAADLTTASADGDVESLGRYLGVGVLRSAELSVTGGPSLPAAGQSSVRLQTDGAGGARVTTVLRQSLRLDSQVAAFPMAADSPAIDCGFSAAVVGVEYWQPLVAACDGPGSRWEASSQDGGEWASAQGSFLGGLPDKAGTFHYEIRLETGLPGGNSSVSRSCSITVVDTPSASAGASNDQPLFACGSAQFASGGARLTATLDADQPLEAGFQTGTVAGTLRYVASFEADGVDVSPYVDGPGAGTAAQVSVATAPPVISSATFSCPSGSQLAVEVAGYAVTREIGSMQFAFQTAPGAAGALQLAGNAAARPDLVDAFKQRYAAVEQALDGGFLMRAIFNVSGRAADIGGVDFTLHNSAGSASVSATAAAPACSSQR